MVRRLCRDDEQILSLVERFERSLVTNACVSRVELESAGVVAPGNAELVRLRFGRSARVRGERECLEGRGFRR